MNERNPFGRSQTELFKFILKKPGCSFNDIWQGCFPDKGTGYLHNLIYENQGFIEKRESADPNYPTEYRIKMATMAGHIDIQHYIKTGKFKAKYVQPEIPFDPLTPF